MEFKQITNKEQWDTQISSQQQSQFLQSWNWGDFQQSLERKFWRLDLNGEYVLVIKMPLPLGKNYFYIPRTKIELDNAKLDILKQFAKKQGSIFLRIDPFKQDLASLGFKKIKPFQPAKTLLLDLSKSEEELLAEMHQKTRYNIRLAEKKGVVLAESTEEQFLKFYDLVFDTYKRKGKKLFDRNYYHKLFQNDLAKIFFAKYESEILTANLVIFYGDTVTYLHGGSSEKHKNIMAPHLLQWETIKKAKSLGYKYYDFWGIEDRYPGVVRFKTGFGGFEVSYPGTFDLPISKSWYKAYRLVKKFK